MKKILILINITLIMLTIMYCSPLSNIDIEWIKLTISGDRPSARYGHSIAYAGEKKVIMFGGFYNSSYLQDTWEFDSSTNTWTEYNTTGTRPAERIHHTLSYAGDSKLILFGGYNGSDYLNDTWEYALDTHTWTEYNTSGTRPLYRSEHTLSYIDNGKLILYGGRYLSGEGKYYYLEDTWEYDVDTHTWTEYNEDDDNPFSRASHNSSYLIDNTLLLFGGYVDEIGNSSDTWEYDLSSHIWSYMDTTKSPSKRIQHRMSYFSSCYAVMFGGYGDYSGNEYLNDAWIFNSTNNQWIETNIISDIPTARKNHSLAHIDDNTILMFGGEDNNNELLSDMWICVLRN